MIARRFFAAVLLTALAPAARADVPGWLLKFAGAPTRYAGSPGHRATLDEVERAFRAYGLTDVHREPVIVVAPVEEGVTIQGPGLRDVVLHAVWPNRVQCPVTPRDGVTGALVDGGHGEATALDGCEVEGAIVLVRLPCAGGPLGWTTPFILGAAAVVFIPPAGGAGLARAEAEDLFLDVPADLPRVWAPGASVAPLVAAARRGVRATLRSRVGWAEIRTANIIGWRRGSPIRFPSDDQTSKAAWRDKTVILQAYTDSMSVVPALAPGGEEAGGLIALLELARRFASAPVPPSLCFVATSGHNHVFAGTADFLVRHIRKREFFTRSITAEEAIKADLFVGLDLSSGDARVASFSQGTFYYGWDTHLLAQNALAGTARVLDAHAEKLWGKTGAGERYLNGVAPPTRSWKDLLGWRAAFDAEVATQTGTPGLTFATPFDARDRCDTPADTAAAVNQGNLGRQIATIGDLLAAALPDAAFFNELKLELPDDARAFRGEVHEFERTITGLPNKPVPHALMTYRAGASWGGGSLSRKTYGTVRGLHAWFSRTDPALSRSETGTFRVPLVRIAEYWQWVMLELEGWTFDADGRIAMSRDLGPLTKNQFSPSVGFQEREGKTLHLLFRCSPLTILEPVDARYLRFLDWITLTDGRDQPFMNEGFSIVANQATAQEAFTPAVVIFAPRMPEVETRVKALLTTGPFGLQGVFTGADEGLLDPARAGFELSEAQGRGYAASRRVLTRAPFEGAKDLWALDDARGRTLKRYNVRNFRIEALHERAHDGLVEAREAWRKRKYGAFLEAARRAWGYEARAYPEFRTVANDLVRTVVFYCVLLLPFSFCLERLFFSFTDLRRQIVATATFFVVAFLALSQVHPAFRISSNPVIIFLAFIILALGLFVLAIITSKFQRELKRMKGERGDYEAVDIGRVSATVAALLLGLSNLRKRPLRTALTVTTIVVLTFTVLSMVSLSSTISFFRLPRGTNPSYTGALVREMAWQSLQPPVETYLRSALEPDAEVLPRSWVMARVREESLILDIECGDRHATLSALLGLTAGEVAVLRPKATAGLRGRWFAPGERTACILPEAVAARLGASLGSRVRVRGVELTVVGLVDGKRLGDWRDLDGESIAPAKFKVSRGRYNWEAGGEPAPTKSPTERFTDSEHYGGDTIAIVPHVLALSLEGHLRSVAVIPRPGVDATKVLGRVKEFLTRAAVIALVSDGQKTSLLTSIGAVSVSGTLDLLLPILLVSLIVLNTMMGSVHERTREISIFSSVGLAPSHIGALFVAEAFVVAVVGVVLGYLFAQIVASVLLRSGTLAGLSLNYSSSAAVGACVVVIAAVMLSTIYPARKASQLSVPDVTRHWKLPPAEGDRLRFDFPFTVGQNDLVGLFTYLAALFRAYRDSSIGSFATDGVIQRRTVDGIAIEMACWLAPYDLGISQQATFEAIPMNVPGLYRVQVTLDRLSGETGSWHRQNRRFLTALRKRFLVWRLFGPEIKARYAEEGARRMEEGARG
ncbi:MAG: FtsX-like permease family protein [Candidatus Coatesbacteria bacterium]